EILLARLEPADAQAAHRQRLDVERLVAERVGNLEQGEIVADVGPVEGGVVTDEDGPRLAWTPLRLDEFAQVAHRPGRFRALLFQVLARNSVDRHRLFLEGASDRLQLDIEAIRPGTVGATREGHR